MVLPDPGGLPIMQDVMRPGRAHDTLLGELLTTHVAEDRVEGVEPSGRSSSVTARVRGGVRRRAGPRLAERTTPGSSRAMTVASLRNCAARPSGECRLPAPPLRWTVCRDWRLILAQRGAIPQDLEDVRPVPAESDGYGTGFVTYLLLQAGVKPNDAAIVNSVKWLKSN